MSEFKFSCPNCQQNISATSDYSGVQINCPVCKTPIIVPADPNAPAPAPAHAGAPPPPPVPAQTRLSKAPSTTSHAATGTAFVSHGPPVRKKKSHTGLYVGLGVGAFCLLGAVIFWHSLFDLGHTFYAKYIHTEPAVKLETVDTNVPPPPPPELATDEILQNVRDKYKGLTTYSVKGQAIAAIDISAIRPGAAIQNSAQAVSLELGRTNLYRLEWQTTATSQPYKGAAWSAGKGDFVGYGPYPATKMRNRETALKTASTASDALCIGLAHLFYDDTNSLAMFVEAFAKTNGPNVTPKINGHDCYVLDGQLDAHDLVIWVDKGTFLIQQIQFIFGGKLDDAKFKDMRPADKAQYTQWSKLKGSITETYQNPEVDKTIAAASFASEFSPLMTAADTAAAGGGGGQQPARPRQQMRGAVPTSPTELTRRVRPNQ